MADEFANGVQRRYNSEMRRIRHRSIPPSLRAIESASRRPTLCFVVRDDENKTGGMIVRENNLPAEIDKTQTPPRSASEVIAEMAAKVARYPAKPKEEWEGMSAEELFQRGWKHDGNKEYAKAVKWYCRAAEQGHAKAQYYLGVSYANGEGVLQNDAEAVKWFRRAAEQGHADAQNNLGLTYDNGRRIPQDYSEAVKWFRRAAEQGHADAQGNLGAAYANGYGVPQDNAEAAKWYCRAAEQGDAQVQTILGLIYTIGHGVPQDYSEAVKWFRHAAEQGFAKAQYQLGVAYANGYGVPQDYSEAVKWFRHAAEQRDIDAQEALRQLEQKK